MNYYDMVRDVYKEEEPSSEDVPAILAPNTPAEWLACSVGQSRQSRESMFDPLPGPSMIALPYINSEKGSFREKPEHITQHRVRIGDPQDSDGAWLGLTFERISCQDLATKIPHCNEILFHLSRAEAETLIENLRKQLG